MKPDGNTLVIKCNNTSVHNDGNKEPGVGNILMFMRRDSLFIQCSNHRCKRWNKIKIKIPGVNFDLSNASFVQSKMPKNYHFDHVSAPVIIEDAC